MAPLSGMSLPARAAGRTDRLVALAAGCLPPLALAAGLLVPLLAPAAGCAPPPRTAAGAFDPPQPPLVEAGDSVAASYGYVTLLIHWPQRDLPGFRAAAIPQSTRALAIQVMRAAAPADDPGLVLTEIATRSAGAGTVARTLRLKAANNYSLRIRAYREERPDLGGDSHIAEGTSAGFNVVRSQTVRLLVELDARFAPVIARVEPGFGTPGEPVVLTGTNLAPVAGASPSIWLDGAAGTASVPAPPEYASATQLRFRVPEGAVVGRIRVRSDGVDSTSNVPFWVPESLLLRAVGGCAASCNLDPLPVVYGDTVVFELTRRWKTAQTGIPAGIGAEPAASWRSAAAQEPFNVLDVADGGASASLRAALTSDGTTTVTAFLGSLVSGAIRVAPAGVDSVEIGGPPSLVLNARPPTLPQDPRFPSSYTLRAAVRTTLPFENGVRWSSSDTELVTVDASGTVQTLRDAPAGTAVVTAESRDRPVRSATVSVRVERRGGIAVRVR